MKRRIDVSLILPCYNEAGLFAESVARIQAVLHASNLTYEVIFVDDASCDGTQKHIRSFCKSGSGIGKQAFRALFHVKNTGRGRAVLDGIRAAKGIVAGYIDIDCEVDPVYIPHMVTQILKKKADVVIGKRYYRTTPRAFLREILSRGYQWLADVLIGTGGLDTETGYKFFSRKKILPLLSKTKHPGWFWDTEIMAYARRKGLTIVEEPVLFLRRFDKQSSVNVVRDTAEYLIHLWRFRRRLQRQGYSI